MFDNEKNPSLRLICFETIACILTDNVALNKPAYQQYPLYPGDDTYDAINAVDGRKTNMSWFGGQCAVSASNKRTATWWVNLTSINSIHHINIYYIKGSAPRTHRIYNLCDFQLKKKQTPPKKTRKNNFNLNSVFDFTSV